MKYWKYWCVYCYAIYGMQYITLKHFLEVSNLHTKTSLATNNWIRMITNQLNEQHITIDRKFHCFNSLMHILMQNTFTIEYVLKNNDNKAWQPKWKPTHGWFRVLISFMLFRTFFILIMSLNYDIFYLNEKKEQKRTFIQTWSKVIFSCFISLDIPTGADEILIFIFLMPF